MSAAFRLISSNSRVVSRAIRPSAHIRAFHSPFAALGDSPLTSTSHPTPTTVYEKQTDHSSEPLSGGSRTYVVSQPDVSSKFYEVPSGAYPTSSPYINYAAAEAPNTSGAQVSSTSSTPLAHEQTIRTVSTHPGGVGASAAVRHTRAPGDMGEGSEGGLGLMDKEGTLPPQATPTDRNPQPDGAIAEEFSKKGLDAWKDRK